MKKRRVLFVCGGNIARSPMAKVILEQMLREAGVAEQFAVDSAAKNKPLFHNATEEARKTILSLYGEDLLASHRPKALTPQLAEEADLILTMSKKHNWGLPQEKTFILKEYAGLAGYIADPFGGDGETYEHCADEIRRCLSRGFNRLLQEHQGIASEAPDSEEKGDLSV